MLPACTTRPGPQGSQAARPSQSSELLGLKPEWRDLCRPGSAMGVVKDSGTNPGPIAAMVQVPALVPGSSSEMEMIRDPLGINTCRRAGRMQAWAGELSSCDAASTENSADPAGVSEDGLALQSCP